MWIKASGDLTENVIQLTTGVSTHLCVIGDEVALVDAGIWGVAEELWGKIEASVESIDYLLLTHAHFDHVGAIPFLREKCPNLKLVAGRVAAELLSDPKFTAKLHLKNVESSDALSQKFKLSKKKWHESLQVDIPLSDGDDLKLGSGVEVKLIQTPGHTEDSVSYYIKPDLVLAAGESLGQYGGRDIVCPTFGLNVQECLASFEKLNALDIQLLSLPHSGVLSGDMVAKFLHAVPEEFFRLVKRVREQIVDGQLIEEISASIAAEWLEEGKFPDGPFQESHRDAVETLVRAARDYKEVTESSTEESAVQDS